MAAVLPALNMNAPFAHILWGSIGVGYLAQGVPYTTLLLVICCAVFYYRVGEYEYGSGELLALVSVVLWVVGIFALGFGWLGNLLLQVGLFGALTLWTMRRQPPK